MTLRAIVIGFVLGMIVSCSAAIAKAEPAKKPVPTKSNKASIEAARAHKAPLPKKVEFDLWSLDERAVLAAK